MNVPKLPNPPFYLVDTHHICREGVDISTVLDTLDNSLLRGSMGDITSNQRRLRIDTVFEEGKLKYTCQVAFIEETHQVNDPYSLPSMYQHNNLPNFVVYVYEKDGLYIVEFQCRMGCVKTFRDIYQFIWDEIRDLDQID